MTDEKTKQKAIEAAADILGKKSVLNIVATKVLIYWSF